MRKLVDDLVARGMAYANPMSRWTCVPLLVPKPGAQFRFTADLQPVNIFTVRHQLPMLNPDQELSGLFGPVYFANLDISHGYWQLQLALL